MIDLPNMMSCGGCGQTIDRNSPYSCSTCGRMLCERCKDRCANHMTEDQRYYRSKREEILEQKRVYRTELKKEALRQLGGKCEECGVEDLDVLEVVGLKRGTMGYTEFYNFILEKAKDFADVEVKCANCRKKK